MKARILAGPGGGVSVEAETEAESEFLGWLVRPTVEKGVSRENWTTLVVSGNPRVDPLTPPDASV